MSQGLYLLVNAAHAFYKHGTTKRNLTFAPIQAWAESHPDRGPVLVVFKERIDMPMVDNESEKCAWLVRAELRDAHDRVQISKRWRTYSLSHDLSTRFGESRSFSINVCSLV
ncbi:hypothetical protein UNDKW_0069 [Undibacterium sp. KW1]|nr:hypothetical protein UNDKW_0069 [Undibacterium sp. KW1]